MLAVDFFTGIKNILASKFKDNRLFGGFTHLILEQLLKFLALFDDGIHLLGNAFIVALLERSLLLLQFGNLMITSLLDLCNLGVYSRGLFALRYGDFIFQTLQRFLASFFVNISNNILSKVQNTIQIAA